MPYVNITRPNTLHELIALRRKSLGISQTEAAQHLDISRPTYDAIEKGSKLPEGHILEQLACLYRCRVKDLRPRPGGEPTFSGFICGKDDIKP